MSDFRDQMNNIIRLESTPSRIVSLVPSQTELLYSLGLEDEVVGITKFCLYPDEWYRGKCRVGGTKNIDINKVVDLKPDLIIGNKEENQKDNINDLLGVAPVWMSDIFNLEDALKMIESVSEITGKVAEGKHLIEEIRAQFQMLTNSDVVKELKGKTVQYFIWHKPDMVAGKRTFIDVMLDACGLINVTDVDRYPEVKLESSPDFIFLSSEPFPFKDKHVRYFQDAFPNAKIKLVDGEMFSWYGSRLLLAPSYFKDLLEELSNQ